MVNVPSEISTFAINVSTFEIGTSYVAFACAGDLVGDCLRQFADRQNHERGSRIEALKFFCRQGQRLIG